MLPPGCAGRCFEPVIGTGGRDAVRLGIAEIKFRYQRQRTTDPAPAVELRGGQHKDRSDKGKPAERRRRKATGLQSPSGIRQPGRRRHLSGSEIVRPVRRGPGPSLVRPHLDGEIAVTSVIVDARSPRDREAPQRRFGRKAAAVAAASRPPSHAHTGAVGRSHTTPTPDPDPRDSGLRTFGALRPSELAPCLCTARPQTAGGTVPPGRAQGLHVPAPLTQQSNGARSPLANIPRLGPAHPYSIGLHGRILN